MASSNFFFFAAIQARPKFCEVGVQCNIGNGIYQRESTPDIVEEENAATEEETDSDDCSVSRVSAAEQQD